MCFFFFLIDGMNKNKIIRSITMRICVFITINYNFFVRIFVRFWSYAKNFTPDPPSNVSISACWRLSNTRNALASTPSSMPFSSKKEKHIAASACTENDLTLIDKIKVSIVYPVTRFRVQAWNGYRNAKKNWNLILTNLNTSVRNRDRITPQS